MVIKNYEEALAHFFDVDMLNTKGLRDYVKILRNHIIESKSQVIGLEHSLKLRREKALPQKEANK